MNNKKNIENIIIDIIINQRKYQIKSIQKLLYTDAYK